MNGLSAWLKMIAEIGFPIAVAVWLLAYASPRIARTADLVEQHQQESSIQTTLLRAICRNTAKTELQGQFCEYGTSSGRR